MSHIKNCHLKFFSLSALLTAAIAAQAADSFDPFKEFKSQITSVDFLKPFAKDIGAIIGGGSFHTGRSLGFPGVDVGGHLAIQKKPSSDNVILNGANVDAFGLPMVQGEVGLPFNIDVILRGFTYKDYALVGGGIRYGLFKMRMLPLSPGIAVSGFVHTFAHNFFSLSHQAANLTVDLSVPLVSPYIGFGIDRTSVKVNSADVAALVGQTATATGNRIALGVNLKLIPLTYLHAAATRYNGNVGYEGGLGVKF
ncbi:MAG: hypothetical protein HY547_00415 [Elusimicrobia bacterium]|nr:hypothetical protein [Elusimicrobiota bacterium]